MDMESFENKINFFLKGRIHASIILIASTFFWNFYQCQGGGEVETSEDPSLNFNLKLLSKRVSRSNSFHSVIISPFIFTRVMTILTSVSGKTVQEEFQKNFNFTHDSMKKFHMEHASSLEKELATLHFAFNGTFYIGEKMQSQFLKEPITALTPIYNTTLHIYEDNNAYRPLNDIIDMSTLGGIPNFFSKGAFGFFSNNIGTVFNTLFFRERWKKEVDYMNYQMQWFQPSRWTFSKIQVLVINEEFEVGEDSTRKVQFIELPLKRTDQYYLMIMLPTEEFKLNDVLRDLNASGLKYIMEQKKTKRKVRLILPRVDADTQLNYSPRENLTPHLKKLGIRAMFNSSDDDPRFPNLGTAGKSIHVKNVEQKWKIIIDHKGVKAVGVINGYLAKRLPEDQDEDDDDDEDEDDDKASGPKIIAPPKGYKKNVKSSKESNTMDFECLQPFLIAVLDRKYKVPLIWGKISFDQYHKP